MRLILISIALASLVTTCTPSFACPTGYAPCGARYCCPAPK